MQILAQDLKDTSDSKKKKLLKYERIKNNGVNPYRVKKVTSDQDQVKDFVQFATILQL